MKFARIYDPRQLPAFLTTQEFAELMSVREPQVRRMCRDGKLPAVHIGKFWRIDKNKALEGHI